MTKMMPLLHIFAAAIVLAADTIVQGLAEVGFDQEQRSKVGNQARQYKSEPLSSPVTEMPQSGDRSVIINRTRLGNDQLRALEQRYRVRIPDGHYWYDKFSGAWGLEGGPTSGFTFPGLNLGGPLHADASRGNTRVFINGRELHYLDVLALQQLVIQVLPGRYWVDAQGYCGYEGGPALLNLVQLAQAANHHRGGKGITSGMYDSGIGSVSGGGFISGSSS
jgi:hypothetical protein